jgi:hypothetical protein
LFLLLFALLSVLLLFFWGVILSEVAHGIL